MKEMIKLNNKILPIKYPEITIYPHHAHLFAVIDGIGVSDKDKFEWLASNYIMVQKGPDNLDFSSGYEILTAIENCPMLECLCVPSIIIKKRYVDIIDFIKEMIDSEMYIYMSADEYYIRFYDNYSKNHYDHTLLIYGYDSCKQIVYAADFFENRKYAFKEISFEEIKKASEFSLDSFLGGIRLLRKRSYYSIEFNIDRLRKSIERYIHGQPPAEYETNNEYIRVYFDRSYMLYGLDIYNGILAEIDNDQYIDVQNCFFIKEHFEVISLLLIYLAKNHMLKKFDIYAETLYKGCKRAEVLLNKAIMYNITYRENIRIEIKEMLLELKNTDLHIMSELLENLGGTNRFNVDLSSVYLHEINGLKNEGAERKGYIYILNDKESYVQASFYGKTIKVDIEFLNKSAVAEVYIDAVKIALLSFKDINSTKCSKVFENLADCQHIVRIVNGAGNFSVHKISSLKPCISHGTVKFYSVDTQNHGNWINNYGSLGYVLPDNRKWPINASVSFFDEKIYSNDDAEETVNMLKSIDSRGRIKKCFCREKEQILRVEAVNDADVIFTLYLLDWTKNGDLVGELIIKDIVDNTVLDRRMLSNLEKGCYISYKVKGVTQWHITLSSPDNSTRKYGDIFGCFFDNEADFKCEKFFF